MKLILTFKFKNLINKFVFHVRTLFSSISLLDKSPLLRFGSSAGISLLFWSSVFLNSEKYWNFIHNYIFSKKIVLMTENITFGLIKNYSRITYTSN